MMSEVIGWILANWQSVVGAVSSILVGVITISLLIPGDQPEKALQWVVDQIKKLSLDKK